MSALLKVGGGLLLLGVGSVGGLILGRASTDSQESQEQQRGPGPDEPATPRTTVDQVAAFLQKVREPFEAAEAACFAAEQCGSIEREPKRGALASATQIPTCLKERVPACGAASEKLTTVFPPAEIAELWSGTIKYRVMRPFQHALLTLQLVTDAGGKAPNMQLPSKGYADIEDWVRVQQLPIAARYAALRDEYEPWQESVITLNEWTRANGLCGTGNDCSMEKVMNAAR